MLFLEVKCAFHNGLRPQTHTLPYANLKKAEQNLHIKILKIGDPL